MKIKLKTVQELMAEGAVFTDTGRLSHPIKSIDVDESYLHLLGKTHDAQKESESMYELIPGGVLFCIDEISEVIKTEEENEITSDDLGAFMDGSGYVFFCMKNTDAFKSYEKTMRNISELF